MNKFKQYRRKQITELREVNDLDMEEHLTYGNIIVHSTPDSTITVSISDEDRKAGSPMPGDMIARNPKNHLDQWLVARQYFKDNFEPI